MKGRLKQSSQLKFELKHVITRFVHNKNIFAVTFLMDVALDAISSGPKTDRI
jgi:hypothetical protein